MKFWYEKETQAVAWALTANGRVKHSLFDKLRDIVCSLTNIPCLLNVSRV